MCPACLTAALVSAAGAASGGGVLALAATRWRSLRQLLRRRRRG